MLISPSSPSRLPYTAYPHARRIHCTSRVTFYCQKMITEGGKPRSALARADSIKIYSYVIPVQRGMRAFLPRRRQSRGERGRERGDEGRNARLSSATFTSSFFIVIITGEGLRKSRNLYFAPASQSRGAKNSVFDLATSAAAAAATVNFTTRVKGVLQKRGAFYPRARPNKFNVRGRVTYTYIYIYTAERIVRM